MKEEIIVTYKGNKTLDFKTKSGKPIHYDDLLLKLYRWTCRPDDDWRINYKNNHDVNKHTL